ncbi:MAG: ABC transporter permease [Eubacteriales bacterium]|nr:ABC transporter permease [Eubacteriales bacterium]
MHLIAKSPLRLCAALTALLVCVALVFAFAVQDAWTQEPVIDTNHVMPIHDVGNLLRGGLVAEQRFEPGCEQLDSITLWPRVAGEPSGEMTVEIWQGERMLASRALDIAQMQDYTPCTVGSLAVPLEPGKEAMLRVYATQSEDDAHFSVFYGDSVAVGGRYEIAVGDIDRLSVSGAPLEGKLTFDYVGYSVHGEVMLLYWALVAALVVAANVAALWLLRVRAAGKSNLILRVIEEVRQYSYLTSRLVSRNFNTKYRQSMLGVLWSVLNPILTMLVLYVVFSTLFRTDTENYIVYLLSGIIVWNFFTEAVNLGLESITNNASIINKVYVPRYIYPISTVVSALINFLIAHIPLVLLCLITGVRITKAYLLLPVAVGYLFLFACGVALLMATSNVFFRDTRFLWSIVTMMWMYLTPIFYTESIISASYIGLYRANPMYQFLYIFRSIIIQGVAPQPIYFLTGLIAAVVPLALGLWVFSRNQNRFVLYL